MFSAPRPSLSLLLTVLSLLLFSHTAQAQFQAHIKLNKETFLTYEPVEATVTITNRSGADVIMGGPSDLPWMTFSVTDPNGREIPSLRMKSEDNFIFKNGDTISRKIVVSTYYPFSEYGIYMVAASVYHPPSQQYFASNRTRATLTDAKPFASRTIGVPNGQPNAGQVRTYTLSTLRDYDRSYLYVRLLEERTKLKLTTFTLGTYVMSVDPQVAVDKQNQLHVLFMAAPQIYAHVTVTPQGKLSRRVYYKEVDGDRPQLVVRADDAIEAAGGQPFDPSSPTGTDVKPKGRSMSERPPGL